MGLNLRKVEIRQLLQSDEDIALFLDEAYQEGGSELFMNCLEIIVREVGMSIISEKSGLGKESLYKTLRPGKKPRFEIMVKILDSLGLTYTIKVKAKESIDPQL
ncbi:MAG: putative addiction module antidote protein [Ignavibacteria bacterium]|nr:putative addiction module antidote protein [Ignavibacteria bacterium]